LSFKDLINRCERRAIHLETRDYYSDPLYAEWNAGLPPHSCQAYRDWQELVRATVVRGVSVRRARIVSEPLSDYIRFEYEVTTELNIAAGEQVRWLPRRQASDVLVPGNDFWVFDDRLVRIHHFDGNGQQTGSELSQDQGLVGLFCGTFGNVWARAVDHSDYRPSLTGRHGNDRPRTNRPGVTARSDI